MTDTILFKRDDLEVSRDENGNYRTVGSTRKIIRELANDLAIYRGLFHKALEQVDKVFQVCSENDKPLLLDFLLCGDDKFEGFVKLAEAYIKHTRTLETIENSCSGYARELAANRLASN